MATHTEVFDTGGPLQRSIPVYRSPRYRRFVADMEAAGIPIEHYRGHQYEGPAARVDTDRGPSLADIAQATDVDVQWDATPAGVYVYPG